MRTPLTVGIAAIGAVVVAVPVVRGGDGRGSAPVTANWSAGGVR